MSGNLDDKLGRKKRSLKELLCMLNDLKQRIPDWLTRIDKLQEALVEENRKVSQDLIADIRNEADSAPGVLVEWI